MANETDSFGFPIYAPDAEADAALKARDEARDVELLAGMGLVRNQRVMFDGDECTVVCAAGEGAVMLHCAIPGRMGFVADGAPIAASALTIAA